MPDVVYLMSGHEYFHPAPCHESRGCQSYVSKMVIFSLTPWTCARNFDILMFSHSVLLGHLRVSVQEPLRYLHGKGC